MAKRKPDFPWEERLVVHTFADDWTVEVLRTEHDRRMEDLSLFLGHSCLPSPAWAKWINQDKTHLLLSLRDKKGIPRATLLVGDTKWVLEGRKYPWEGHFPYSTCEAFDQAPRSLFVPLSASGAAKAGRSLIMLQCCPQGMPGGDMKERRIVTRRSKVWWEALPYG